LSPIGLRVLNKKLNQTIASVTVLAYASTAPATLAG